MKNIFKIIIVRDFLSNTNTSAAKCSVVLCFNLFTQYQAKNYIYKR
jgi:hypothetical protein